MIGFACPSFFLSQPLMSFLFLRHVRYSPFLSFSSGSVLDVMFFLYSRWHFLVPAVLPIPLLRCPVLFLFSSFVSCLCYFLPSSWAARMFCYHCLGKRVQCRIRITGLPGEILSLIILLDNSRGSISFKILLKSHPESSRF